MGNVTSKSAEGAPEITVPDTMSEHPAGVIDIMATHFITSQQSKDNNLTDANYCNNLVEWLSNIIHEGTTSAQIMVLSANKFPSSEPGTKMVDCQKLAKYYVQIAQVYNAILGAIQPMFKYETPSGGFTQLLTAKQSLNPTAYGAKVGAKAITLLNNPCSKRLRTLLGESSMVKEMTGINPSYCSINKDTSNLNSIPGMAYLEELYKDKYNPDTGMFDSMTPYTAKQYKEAVHELHLAYTEDPLMDSSVDSFMKIKLKNYELDPGCVIGQNRSQDPGEESLKMFQKLTKALESKSTYQPQPQRHQRSGTNWRYGYPYGQQMWGHAYGQQRWGHAYGQQMWDHAYGQQYHRPVTAPTFDENTLPAQNHMVEYIKGELRRSNVQRPDDRTLKILLEQPEDEVDILDWPLSVTQAITSYRDMRNRLLKEELKRQKESWKSGRPDDKERKQEWAGYGVYREKNEMKHNNQLLKDYGAGIRKMEDRLFREQNKLLAILDNLFVYMELPESGITVITINPKLKEEDLEKNIIPDVRRIITDLYKDCENDFNKMIQLFEAAVAEQQIKTLDDQIVYLVDAEKRNAQLAD